MEELGARIRDKIKSLKPLPRPENEEEKFLGDFHHLSQRQIREILRLVIDEAEKSKKFGLHINGELLEREEVFCLTVFDHCGGVNNLIKGMEYEDAFKITGEIMNDFFEEERESYFRQFSQAEDFGSRNRYQVHLESLRGSLLRAAYNGKLPP